MPISHLWFSDSEHSLTTSDVSDIASSYCLLLSKTTLTFILCISYLITREDDTADKQRNFKGTQKAPGLLAL